MSSTTAPQLKFVQVTSVYDHEAKTTIYVGLDDQGRAWINPAGDGWILLDNEHEPPTANE